MTVQTEFLGAVRVRRITLGGVAASAQRLRTQADPDGIALVDALIAEATTREGTALDASSLEALTEQDRRAIATAMLTLEGIKAGGADDPEDPRAVLARRYHEIVGTRPTVPVASAPGGGLNEGTYPPSDDGNPLSGAQVLQGLAPGAGPTLPATGVAPAAADAGQIALFELPAEVVRGSSDAPRSPAASRVTVDKVNTRLDDLARRLEPLETADHTRQALMSASAKMDGRIQSVEAGTRRLVWGAVFALAAVLAGGIASTVVLASKLSATRTALEDAQARLAEQSQVIDELKRAVLARPTTQDAPRAPARKVPKTAGKTPAR